MVEITGDAPGVSFHTGIPEGYYVIQEPEDGSGWACFG